MAENTLVSEGVKAAETLQAERKAKEELEALAAKASLLAKGAGSGWEETERCRVCGGCRAQGVVCEVRYCG